MGRRGIFMIDASKARDINALGVNWKVFSGLLKRPAEFARRRRTNSGVLPGNAEALPKKARMLPKKPAILPRKQLILPPILPRKRWEEARASSRRNHALPDSRGGSPEVPRRLRLGSELITSVGQTKGQGQVERT